ncbi:cysteine desulfurase [Heyndrickxia sporothermodurans]|uniref:Cysteine desulfurase n=1 Tax=Heyndrickxia sporothermodurans TaxID=46224 RepID=A0A150LET8_9BACI|nr:cysteine desulfurase family protein [Heyndrickxia sporothermodurans]KYD10765.1 Cysteine desulfurase [Heyndrickxia sporothermodurans]MBL5768974.1 cysteine desulfurase [Heyndrickxia sporothermodurans]MBL5772746.1 cysteine desulfurase [Heyndrickxia sporothermodurans]MBL5776237.1 cysteine desulfurase [Heyndrickxia sporothermodurans]MBL5779768.1 cysteine desulfurase [Heyndrickxia sporothermodurans]
MIYFDNSATTKPYDEVIDAFAKVSKEYYANPSSLHNFGGKVETLVNQARKQISNLLHVKENEIYFTSGGTEGNNLAIKGTALAYRSRGNHIITTRVEHPSVYEACEQLSKLGFEITYLPVDEYGQVDINDLSSSIRDNTILVSIMHVNNEMGAVQPIEEIGELLTNYPKILFHVDHVQGIGKIPLLLHQAKVDLCSISAHKFHGLKGIGVLYIRDGIRISPLFSGGNQENKVRSGTENVSGIVTMAKALRLTEEKRKQKRTDMLAIRDYLILNLKKMPSIKVNTNPTTSAPHIINFSAIGLKGEVIVHALEAENIYVSTTSACSSKQKSISRTLQAMGVTDEEAIGAVRISLSYDNTMDEAKIFITKLERILTKLYEVVGDTK